MRSNSGAGGIVQFAFLDKGFSPAAAKEAVAEVRENQKYFYGDYYPLTGCSAEPDRFVAYQVHRPDLDAGLVLAFRRAKCNVPGIQVSLGGLRPERDYDVEFSDERRHKTTQRLSGRVLGKDLPLSIAERGRQSAGPLSPGRRAGEDRKGPDHLPRGGQGPHGGTGLDRPGPADGEELGAVPHAQGLPDARRRDSA